MFQALNRVYDFPVPSVHETIILRLSIGFDHPKDKPSRAWSCLQHCKQRLSLSFNLKNSVERTSIQEMFPSLSDDIHLLEAAQRENRHTDDNVDDGVKLFTNKYACC